MKNQLHQLNNETYRKLTHQTYKYRNTQKIKTLLTAFTPKKNIHPLLTLKNIFINQNFNNKKQTIQFLYNNLDVNKHTKHPFKLKKNI